VARLSILDRFRPVGAPGAAGPAGVPAADDQGPAAELAPVFAALADHIASCAALVDDAHRSADEAVVRARVQAAAILAQARLDAGAERATAAARVEQEGSSRDTQVLEQARREAAALEEAGLARIPAVVAEVMDALLAPKSEGLKSAGSQ
jgi:vacuolar-type H+-ATPase subunit H